MWLGIDDTDSTKGGCTTYVAKVLIEKLTKKYDIIDYPRLVRLNPNVPWKTRGNGAISFQIGYGSKKIKIGEINGNDIFSCTELIKDVNESDLKTIKKIVEKTINEYTQFEDEKTNPGFVLIKDQPNNDNYNLAVTKLVSLDETIELLKRLNADFIGYKNKRGLIGATSSIAWNYKPDKTYEVITYRKRDKWGTKRFVDEDSVKLMDKKYKSTFDNFDFMNNHNRIMPNSPCPILYGIRGDNPKELQNTLSVIKSEPVDCWLIFKTNQGTDDHLIRKKVVDINPYDSIILKGEVAQNPYTIHGGHVFFKIKDETGIIDCAAYEPTKEFRNIIRGLFIGDIIEIYGGIREKPLTVNIEKIKIIKLIKIKEKIENPICPNCNKHMKSIGKNQGFRCKICGTKSKQSKFKDIKRKIDKGFYEVPVCARRHLSKPLKRDKII